MRNRLVWISLLCLVTASAAQAATVRIPALAGGRAKVQLVDQETRTPIIGFDGPEWATAYEALAMDTAQSITLTPTADIATVAARATCYLVTASASGGRGWSECVQVAEVAEVQELRDLVGASGIDPADITAGQVLTNAERAALDAANDPSGANAIATMADLLGPLTPSALTLTNTVWDDLRFPAQAINPVGSAAPPSVDTADGTLLFSATQTNVIAGIAQLPHKWAEGTAVYPHVHWSPTTTNVGNVAWRVEYEAQDIGGTFVGFTASDTLEASDGTAEKHQIHSLAAAGIDMTGKKVSTIIKWKLSRIGGDGTDTFTGSARLLELDFHYEIDSLGSSAETVK